MQNQIQGGLKGKELAMGSRGLRWSKRTLCMQPMWHGGRRSPRQDPAQGDGFTCTQPPLLVVNHAVGGHVTRNQELPRQKHRARSPSGGMPCSGGVSSKRSRRYLWWILRHLGFFSGPEPRSPVNLPVLFSHSVVCVPTKRISPLGLFSLGKDGWGRSPPLPRAVLV